MKLFALFALALAMTSVAGAAEKDNRVYEMRVYYAAEGKLDLIVDSVSAPHAQSSTSVYRAYSKGSTFSSTLTRSSSTERKWLRVE